MNIFLSFSLYEPSFTSQSYSSSSNPQHPAHVPITIQALFHPLAPIHRYTARREKVPTKKFDQSTTVPSLLITVHPFVTNLRYKCHRTSIYSLPSQQQQSHSYHHHHHHKHIIYHVATRPVSKDDARGTTNARLQFPYVRPTPDPGRI
jgi:hypothetical protein